MKQTKTILSLFAIILLGMSLSSCKQKVAETLENTVTIEVPQNPYLVAIEHFLIDSFGKN